MSSFVLANRTTFSAASTVTIDNVFTSGYDAYELLMRFSGSANDTGLSATLRVGGVNATANYNYQRAFFENTTISNARVTGTGSMQLGGSDDDNPSVIRTIIMNPQAASVTTYTSNCYYFAASGRMIWFHGMHTLETAYDGISISPGSGTITGNIEIYGYSTT